MDVKTLSAVTNDASEGYSYFETAKRENGDEFVRKTENAPEWVGELLHATHDDARILPDDYRYRWTWDALGFLAEFSGDEIEDAGHEFADDVTPYTAERFAWLASNLTRQGYIDEAVDEYGIDTSEAFSVDRLVGMGMYVERLEVFEAVLSFLEARIEAVA